MVRINSVNSVSNSYNFVHQKTAFKGNDTQTNPQTKQLEDVKPDFAVKTPISYTKTGEIDFPYDTKAHCYKLANGQKVIIVQQEGETVLRTYVNTGSMNEPDKIRGISHYIEHNLFNGSEGLEEGDFFKQVNKMGASTNASTGFAETNYYISSNLLGENDLENKIKLHASMLETPIFAVEKLEKEKGIVNSEINMITSDPQNIAINKMLKNLYGIQTSSQDMIGGTTDNITNLTREDVVNYFNNNYYPANMVTVITGDVNPDETIKLISKYFTSKKAPAQNRHYETLKPTTKTIREDIISDKATASTIVVGFNGPASDDMKDRIYMEALISLLSLSPASRMDKSLKPLNTGAFAQDEKISSNHKDGRTIMFVSESTEKNSEKVLKTIFNEIGNVPNNPPTDKEMQIIKKYMMKSFSRVLEDSFMTNDAIGTAILENNQEYLNNFEKIVKDMTAQDLVDTAKKYLDVNKASVTVVHPATATKESITKNYNAISFTGVHKEAINMSSVKEFNMPNNYKLLTVNSKTDNVKILLEINVDKDVEKSPAATIVLNELLNEGSMYRKQEDFDADLAQEGIGTVFHASEHGIRCSAGCDTSNIPLTISSIKEVLDNPRFTSEDFEHAKNVILDRISTSEKSAYDKLDCELFKGMPKGMSKEELLAEVEALKLDDVKALYNKIYSEGKGIISVAAPFDRNDEVKNTVFTATSYLKPVQEFKAKVLKEKYSPVDKAKVLTNTDSKNQAEIIEAFKFKRNGNLKDEVTIGLLNIIFGSTPSSRLFMDLREKEKLAYHVKSRYGSYEDIGIFALRIGTTTENKETGETSFDNVQKSIDGFNRHIEKIKTEKVTEEELEDAKLYFKNAILNSNHSASEKNSSLADGVDSPYGIYRENEFLDMIDKITTDDIYNAANYIFAEKPIYSILATENTIKANEEYLNKLAQ